MESTWKSKQRSPVPWNAFFSINFTQDNSLNLTRERLMNIHASSSEKRSVALFSNLPMSVRTVRSLLWTFTTHEREIKTTVLIVGKISISMLLLFYYSRPLDEIIEQYSSNLSQSTPSRNEHGDLRSDEQISRNEGRLETSSLQHAWINERECSLTVSGIGSRRPPITWATQYCWRFWKCFRKIQKVAGR